MGAPKSPFSSGLDEQSNDVSLTRGTGIHDPLTPVLKIVSWNIAGLSRNLDLPDWTSFMEAFAICAFQETWSLTPQYRVGSTSYFVPASISESGRGRPSGGLLIWVDIALGLQIKVHCPKSPDLQRLSLKSSGSGISLELFNIYTRGDSGSAISPTLLVLDSELRDCPPNSLILLMGDFNCTYEPLSHEDILDLSEEDSRKGIPSLNLPPVKRWTPRVVQLNALTLEFGLRASNGRTTSDPNGAHTFNRVGSTSRIDYILLSLNLWAHLVDMKVAATTDSDHNPLCLSLTPVWKPRGCPARVSTPSAVRETNEVIPANCLRRLKWDRVALDPLKITNIGEIMSNAMSELGQGTLNPGDISTLFCKTTSLIGDLFTVTRKARQANGQSRAANKEGWYTPACRAAKKAVITAVKQGEGATITSKRKLYKAALIMARRDWEDVFWAKLKTASGEKNARGFWTLIREKSRPTDSLITCNISEEAWFSHFSKLYNVGEGFELDFAGIGSSPDTTPCSETAFTPKEVERVVTSLVPLKAAGPDGIPGDLLRKNPVEWGILIASLLNASAEGAPLPDSWMGAEVVPIYKKGSREDPANYRPISLIDCSQKVAGKVVLGRLLDWIDDNNILSDLQAGFRAGTGTIEQSLRLLMLYWKVVVLGKGSLYLAFIDLRTAFDLVPRQQLWRILQEMGMPHYLLSLIVRLHTSNFAQVRWGTQGQKTGRIEVGRGVRQGCVLAPTLFSLYVNGVVDHLLSAPADAPRLAGQLVPTLLFADDTLLISKSPAGLQRLLSSFELFCNSRGLKINTDKTKYLILNPPKKLGAPPLLDNVPLERTREFDYLGIRLVDSMKWDSHLNKMLLNHKRITGTLLKEQRASSMKPIGTVLEIYAARGVSSALYGAELWGALNMSQLTLSENNFFRNLMSLQASAPTIPLQLDLGCRTIEDQARLRPLLLWARIWRVKALTSYAEGLREILDSSSWAKVRWLRDIKALLLNLGLGESWEQRSAPPKSTLKKMYWSWITEKRNTKTNLCRATRSFLLIKDAPSREIYLDIISIPWDRALFFKFRTGSLPIREFTSRWKPPYQTVSSCPFCPTRPESIGHMFFECPAYKLPRRKWIKPVCLILGARRCADALRILQTDTCVLIVSAVAKFLGWTWRIRSKWLKQIV